MNAKGHHRSGGAFRRADPRYDANVKVSGQATYTSDIVRPGMMFAKVLRSPHAHARIVSIDGSVAQKAPGVVAVVTRDDLLALPMPVQGFSIKDQPIIATDKVRYQGEIVAAVAAETEEQANAALELIKVEYQLLSSNATVADALADGAEELFENIPWAAQNSFGPGASSRLRPRRNVSFEFSYETGPQNAFASCDQVFEDEFTFSRMGHFHLEPFVSIAELGDDGRVHVLTSTQTPFVIRAEIARIFGLQESMVSIKVPFVGGGFGAKTHCKIEPLTVLLAMKAQRPVRLCLTMEEAFLTVTQHAAILRLKTGVTNDGRLMARQSRIWLDAGAYSDASPLVAAKAAYRVPGPYRWSYIKTDCACVMTNTVPSGAFRGFGGPQAVWASESQVDMIARRLGIDPYEYRIKNLLELGDQFVPGESPIDSDLKSGFERVAQEIGREKRRSPRGIGFAIGFKDGGGQKKAADASVRISTSGEIHLNCGTVEIGQGAQTAMAAIVADVLDTSPAHVDCQMIDTDSIPYDQGTSSSSGAAMMGRAVEQAALNVRRDVLSSASKLLDCDPEELSLSDWAVRKGNERYPLADLFPPGFGGPGFSFLGAGSCATPPDANAPLGAQSLFWEVAWAAAEVSVDTETGRVLVNKLVVSGDAGAALNTATCRGQDEGSAMMGYGQALFEHMIYDDTRLVNGEALRYRVPLAEDLPAEFVSLMEEQGHGPGPYGAKGVGEGCILPVPSAIANAVEDAIGVRVTTLPLSPQNVHAAIQRARAMLVAGR